MQDPAPEIASDDESKSHDSAPLVEGRPTHYLVKESPANDLEPTRQLPHLRAGRALSGGDRPKASRTTGLKPINSLARLQRHERKPLVQVSATMTQGTLSPRSPLPPSGSFSPVQITLLRGGTVAHQLDRYPNN